ncbi:MAG: hypothetical protein IBX36_00525 [Dehalococcoidia bacterium]|nr:hypothetical protein [Dehalococcoidia bacterium]
MERKKLDKFPEQILEHVSKLIGERKTSSEITEFFAKAGYPQIKHDGSTKWRFIYQELKDLNAQPDGQYHVAKIIQEFCNPLEWISEEEQRMRVSNDLNRVLMHVGLQLNQKGKLVISTEERELERPEAGALTVNPIFRTRDIKLEHDLCFVLMPFAPAFDRLYEDHIKPAIQSEGFKCLKADELFSPTPITEDIWTYILKSRVILADVTGRNPNVFYELGIAHTIGKPVILIAQNSNDIPFDIAYIRCFLYSDDSKGWATLKESISPALKTISIAET